MITPQTVVQAIVDLLNDDDNKESLGITQAVEGSEDLRQEDLTPPYCIVYSDFNEESLFTDDGTPNNIPVDIMIACVSNEHKIVKDSFNEAFTLAIEVYKLVHKEYDLPSYNDAEIEESIQLKCKSPFMRIGRKSAQISSVIIYLKYEIPLIHNE